MEKFEWTPQRLFSLSFLKSVVIRLDNVCPFPQKWGCSDKWHLVYPIMCQGPKFAGPPSLAGFVIQAPTGISRRVGTKKVSLLCRVSSIIAFLKIDSSCVDHYKIININILSNISIFCIHFFIRFFFNSFSYSAVNLTSSVC